jgi:hypothetical protein
LTLRGQDQTSTEQETPVAKPGLSTPAPAAARRGSIARSSQSTEWYSEGQSRSVEVDGIRITIRFVGRRGRRGRIAIEAPAGAVFRAPLTTLE